MPDEHPQPCMYCAEFTLNDDGVCDDCVAGIVFADGPEAA